MTRDFSREYCITLKTLIDNPETKHHGPQSAATDAPPTALAQFLFTNDVLFLP